jgi:hypothetical protein
MLLAQAHLLMHRHFADVSADARTAAIDLALADDELLLDDRDVLLLDDVAGRRAAGCRAAQRRAGCAKARAGGLHARLRSRAGSRRGGVQPSWRQLCWRSSRSTLEVCSRISTILLLSSSPSTSAQSMKPPRRRPSP